MKRMHFYHNCLVLCIALGILSGCFWAQTFDSTQNRIISLNADDLETHGLAFITPSTPTGQEEEKQGIALIFVEVIKKIRPSIRTIGLPDTINAINKAGLAEDYKRMFVDYRDTGVLSRDLLRKVGGATGVKYVGQLKLMSFSQGTQNRFGILGLRLIETKSAHLRLFFQIWDTKAGTIVWEGVQELHYAVDAFSEKIITERQIVEKAAKDFVEHLPK
jgi:hypothetical protein